MITIDDELKNAIEKAATAHGSVLQLALKINKAHTTVRDWISGKTKRCNDEVFEKLLPYLKPYLKPESYAIWAAAIEPKPVHQTSAPVPPRPPDTIRNTPELRECIKDAMMRMGATSAADLNRLIGYDSPNTLERLLAGKLNWFPDVLSAVLEALEIKHDDAPLSPAERMLLLPEGMFAAGAILVRPIPVVAWANAASHIDMLCDPNARMLYRWDPETTETVPAPMGTRKGTQAFRVSGVSMEPTILDEDILLVEQRMSFEEIPNNKVVVVRFTSDATYDDCIVCKRFRKVGDALTLNSDNPQGLSFQIEARYVAWLGQVVQKVSRL